MGTSEVEKERLYPGLKNHSEDKGKRVEEMLGSEVDSAGEKVKTDVGMREQCARRGRYRPKAEVNEQISMANFLR